MDGIELFDLLTVVGSRLRIDSEGGAVGREQVFERREGRRQGGWLAPDRLR
jgi:hypothetical protein